MTNSTLFPWVINLHRKNLEDYLAAGKPHVAEGEENKAYKGLFVVSNGATLRDTLMQDGVINAKNSLVLQRVSSEKDFNNYLVNQTNYDGGHVHDGINNLMMHVPKFDSNKIKMSRLGHLLSALAPGFYQPKELEYEQWLPEDFVSKNGHREPTAENLGTKTMSAVELLHRYPHVDVYLIKQTAYGDTGMGKAVHLNKHGVVEEFFFQQAAQGPYLNEEHKIVGVHRKYERVKGVLRPTSTDVAVDLTYNTPRSLTRQLPVLQYA